MNSNRGKRQFAIILMTSAITFTGFFNPINVQAAEDSSENFKTSLTAGVTTIMLNALQNVKDELNKEEKAAEEQESKRQQKLKSHPYTESEVELLAKLMYREMGGYYINPSGYGLTKIQGLRAAILTSVVVRNRRDTVDAYSSITRVLSARGQYGKGGQETLNEIKSVKIAKGYKDDFYKIAKAVLEYNEVELAEELVGNEPGFRCEDFKISKSVYYQSQYTHLGSKTYTQIGNQVYRFR